MIAYLEGSLMNTNAQTLTVAVQSVGYAITVARPEQFTLSHKVKLYIHMHWSADNGPALYGFTSEQEKTVFLLVIGCSGLGPKIGLAVLQQFSPADFLRVIQEGDEKALSSVSGIGIKKAEQMIVQLRHKVAKLIDAGAFIDAQGDHAALEQWRNITQVLQSLHYSRAEIDAALSHLRKQKTEGVSGSFDVLVRQALSFLAKKV